MDTVNTLVVSKGHEYDRNAFHEMLDNLPGIRTTLVEQPAAQVLLQPAHATDYDAVLFYDMSGIPGIGSNHDNADGNGLPSHDYRNSIETLIAGGSGIVLLNHATVSWPRWPLWREISGTSFMLQAGELNGVRVPGSGYRGGHGPFPNPTLQLVPEGDHPVLDGLADGFEITDEIYLKTAEFESRVLPLLRGNYDFVAENFTPPPLASQAEQADWRHPAGSNLLVWANSVEASPVVAADLGDGEQAFENPGFRRLLGNALSWVSSAQARAWAQARRLDQAARRRS